MGYMVGSPEEVVEKKWINDNELLKISTMYKNEYGIYLKNLIIY